MQSLTDEEQYDSHHIAHYSLSKTYLYFIIFKLYLKVTIVYYIIGVCHIQNFKMSNGFVLINFSVIFTVVYVL